MVQAGRGAINNNDRVSINWSLVINNLEHKKIKAQKKQKVRNDRLSLRRNVLLVFFC